MKITFLGTSHGIPMADRFCSSTMIETGGRVYLIDCGAPVADLLIRRGIPFSAIRAVFITHLHDDHTGGLPALCSLSNWAFKDTDYDVFLPEEAGITALRNYVETMDKQPLCGRIRLNTYTPGVIYADDRITVTAIATMHMQPYPSNAFVLEAEGKRLIFTGDLHGGDAADFPKIAKEEPSDLIVCEGAHFDIETILPITTACPTKRVWFHHGYRNHDHAIAVLKDADGKYPMEIHPAADGDVLEM